MAGDVLNGDGGKAAGPMEAIYFDSSGRTLYAWLHRAEARPVRDFGLVICKPFGYEAICSHRSVRALAETAAAWGIPTIRFDYCGTGDSAEIDPDEDQIDIWTDDVVAAADELRRRTGVSNVGFVGIRLGALLALRAAPRAGVVPCLILVAPVLNGRKYLRELRTTRLAAMLGSESLGREGDTETEPSVLAPGALEVTGFLISAATVATLEQIDVIRADLAPEIAMLVIDGESLPVSRHWVADLLKMSRPVTYKTESGLVQMLATAPQFAEVPHHLIETVFDWVRSIVDRNGNRLLTKPADEATNLGAPQLLEIRSLPLPDPRYAEHPVRFGVEARLFGIVTACVGASRRVPAIILLNAGADYHVGASGMYVAFARRWVRYGYLVLRMDLAGLGDSQTRTGQSDDDVFPPDAMDDVNAAIEFLRGTYDVSSITVAGLCSGAYHALRAGTAGLPVSRILMINPQNYYWNDGMELGDIQAAELVRNPSLYRSRLFSYAGWGRLLAGQVNVSYILKIFFNRIWLDLTSKARQLARFLHIRLTNDLGWELQRLARRGVKLVFFFAKDEPGLGLLRIQAGNILEKIEDQCRIVVLPSGDHVFSKYGDRSRLNLVMDEELINDHEKVQGIVVGPFADGGRKV
jgi:pimeloyl-ACP methyl ester carboxylesterase